MKKNPNYPTNPYFSDRTIALPMKIYVAYLLVQMLDIRERKARSYFV